MALFGKKKKANDAAVFETTTEVPQEAAAEKAAAPVQPKLKARPDVYTLILGLSVAALVIATVLLYLNYNAYGGDPLSGMPRP